MKTDCQAERKTAKGNHVLQSKALFSLSSLEVGRKPRSETARAAQGMG